MGETDPGPLMQLSGNILLNTPGGPAAFRRSIRIDDDPVIDHRPDRGKTSPDDMALIFNDHVQTNRFFHYY